MNMFAPDRAGREIFLSQRSRNDCAVSEPPGEVDAFCPFGACSPSGKKQRPRQVGDGSECPEHPGYPLGAAQFSSVNDCRDIRLFLSRNKQSAPESGACDVDPSGRDAVDLPYLLGLS